MVREEQLLPGSLWFLHGAHVYVFVKSACTVAIAGPCIAQRAVPAEGAEQHII